ncbi:MAG: hypothetical protein M3R04_10335 [bacterium]|nr:hypothetical protein [bacterium]
MSATNAFETNLLTLYFNNTDHANVGDAAGIQNSAAAGSMYVSLHTADPGEAGTQTTSESAYTNYARVAVARSGAGWTVATNNVSNAAIVSFPTGGATGSLVTHFGIGSDLSGAGNLFFKGALTSSLQVNSGITPSFAIGELDVNVD